MYEARLSRRANRELVSLENSVRRRIVLKLQELQDDPFPPGAAKLQGRLGIYRVRVGDYRILYQVFRDEKLVLVDKIDHRSTVYE